MKLAHLATTDVARPKSGRGVLVAALSLVAFWGSAAGAQEPSSGMATDLAGLDSTLSDFLGLPGAPIDQRIDSVESVDASFDCETVDHSGQLPDSIHPGPYDGQLDVYRARLFLSPAEEIATTGMAAHAAMVELDDRSETPYDPLDLEAPTPTIKPMWWEAIVGQPIGFAASIEGIDVNGLTQATLVASPYVQGLLTEPKIRCNDLAVAHAEFDATAFIESRFTATNEPVGSALTTGNASTRYRDDLFASSIGVRRRNQGGSNVELVQRGGFQENNSTFLTPNPQGTSRLELNFSQPLLRGRGQAVNLTPVFLARVNVLLARSETRAEVESHLTDVTQAYWDLYQARCEFLQQRRLLESAQKLHETLQARGQFDTQQRQILRAEVAITRRASELIRVETRIRNSQARLRQLTGSPQLVQASTTELLPLDSPLSEPVAVTTRQATLTALDHRPDIAQAIRKIQTVSIKVGAARNQILPRLDLLLSSYVAGLDGRSDTFGAIGRQFTDGGPSFAAGFQFEMPYGNRANEARLRRNKWELTRTVFEFQQTTEAAITAVEIAVRETQTTYAEMIAKRRAVEAAQREVTYLEQRWRWLPDPNDSVVLLLEDLLDAQERLTDEERALTEAHVSYALSWIELRQAMGVLLKIESAEQVGWMEPADHE